jgi:hypothetical protein
MPISNNAVTLEITQALTNITIDACRPCDVQDFEIMNNFFLLSFFPFSDPVLGKIASYRVWFEKRLGDAIQAADAKQAIEQQQQPTPEEKDKQKNKKEENGNRKGP